MSDSNINELEELYLEQQRMHVELRALEKRMRLNLDDMVGGSSMDILKFRALELFGETGKHRYVFSMSSHYRPYTIKALAREHSKKNELVCSVEMFGIDQEKPDKVKLTVSDCWGEHSDFMIIAVSDAGYAEQLAKVKADAIDRKSHEEARIRRDSDVLDSNERRTYEKLKLKFDKKAKKREVNRNENTTN